MFCHVPGRERAPFQKRGTLRAEKVNSIPASRFVSSRACSTNSQELAQGSGIGTIYNKPTGKPVTVYPIERFILRNPDWRHRLALVKHDIHLAG